VKQKCTRMHQILFQFPFFPDPRHWGLCPIPPGREGGDAREGRERGGKGEGEGKGMGEVCVIAVGVIDAPGVR